MLQQTALGQTIHPTKKNNEFDYFFISPQCSAISPILEPKPKKVLISNAQYSIKASYETKLAQYCITAGSDQGSWAIYHFSMLLDLLWNNLFQFSVTDKSLSTSNCHPTRHHRRRPGMYPQIHVPWRSSSS